MKRKLLLSMAVLSIMCQCFLLPVTAMQAGDRVRIVSHSMMPRLKIAISKYKAGNYTGCLEDTQALIKVDPSNYYAYYYMAMSYVQVGNKDKAIEAYQKVLSLHINPVLTKYAEKGKRCIETPELCKGDDKNKPELTEIDKMVGATYVGGLSETARAQLEEKRLQMIKNEMNTENEVNNYKLKQFKDYTNQRSQVDDGEKIARADNAPNNDEIVAAMKVLERAGLNAYSHSNTALDGYAQMNNNTMTQQSPESAQLSMLMGSGNQSGNNNNNNMMNMIPFMLAQSKNGQGNSGNPYSPQLMQSMMMNSMLPDFNFNTDKDR